MTRYMKTIAALLGSIATWGVAAGEDGILTMVEYFGLLGVLATVVGVYAIPNTPPDGGLADPDMSEQNPELGEDPYL